MKIHVIIPIFYPPTFFKTRIVPLLQKQTLATRLLVINSGRENISIPDSEMITIPQCEFDHSNTRNLVLSYQSDFYLFMTQDATPYDELLVENLLKAFDDPAVVVAYARQIPYKDADAIEVFARTTNYPPISKVKSKDDLPTMGIKTFFCSDSCAMYRASYFQHVGGFKKDLCTNEDMEFSARAIMNGKKVAYVAEAKVYHSHHFTCKDIWKRYLSIGRFFKENSWILEEVSHYISAESTGIKQMLCELKYLLRHAPLDIPRSIFVSIIKYIAFKSSF
jgi:rhamnosyltransferase